MAEAGEDLSRLDLCSREKWIDTPCGITIKSKNINICDNVRDSLGGVGQQLIRQTTAMCQCIPQALDLIGKGLINEVAASSDVSSATSSILGQFAKLQTCFLDSSFAIQDNKAALLATGALSPVGGWTVIQAAEIDLSTYINFAADIAPCFVGACNPDLIRAFFTNYLQKSQALMSKQLTAFLMPWTKLLEGVKQQMRDLGGAFDSLGKETESLQKEIDAIRGELYKNERECGIETVTRFYDKVSERIALEQEFAEAKDAVEDIVEAVTRMVKLVENVLVALEVIPDADSLIQLITSGQLKKIADIGQALKVGKDIPNLVKDLTDALPTVTGFVARLEQQGPKLKDSFTETGSDVWLNDPQVASEAAGNARAGILRIQTLFRGPIVSTITDLTSRTTQIYTALTTLPFHGRSLSLDVSVASYQRWSPISLDLPCTRTATKKFTVAGGFSGSFDYPQFYSCPYSNKIEWPNHHIPYLKFRFGGPTAHQLASFVAFAEINGTEAGPDAAALDTFVPVATTFAPTPTGSPTASASAGATNLPFSFTAAGVPLNGTTGTAAGGENASMFPALVGSSPPGVAGKVTVTYFTNGSFAGQFDEVEGVDVVVDGMMS
ncbi:hypothetical protein MMC16_004464 [Acarospora aff. strigata]|nr:hypothetical protein [Acarospora aff. strigata]